MSHSCVANMSDKIHYLTTIYVDAMTHPLVWHDSLMCVTWLMHTSGLYDVIESRLTYEWDMSHIWMGHVTRMNESGHTYARIVPHVWMCHATRMNESCHIYEWVMTHNNNANIKLVSMDLLPSDLFKNGSFFDVIHDSIHIREITHSHVWHDSSICLTWLIHMCEMTHSKCTHRLSSWIHYTLIYSKKHYFFDHTRRLFVRAT